MIGANCGLKEDEEPEKMAKTAQNISARISKERGLEDFGRKYIYEIVYALSAQRFVNRSPLQQGILSQSRRVLMLLIMDSGNWQAILVLARSVERDSISRLRQIFTVNQHSCQPVIVSQQGRIV